MFGRLVEELAQEGRDKLERRAYHILAEEKVFGDSVQRIWVSKPSQNSLYSTATFEDVYRKKEFDQRKLGFVSLGKFSKAVYGDKVEPLLGFSVKGLNVTDQNLLREIIAGWFGDVRDNLREMYAVVGSHMRKVDGEDKLFLSTEIMDERIGSKFSPNKEKPQNVISIGAMIKSFGSTKLQKQIGIWKKRRDEAMGVGSKKRDAPCTLLPTAKKQAVSPGESMGVGSKKRDAPCTLLPTAKKQAVASGSSDSKPLPPPLVETTPPLVEVTPPVVVVGKPVDGIAGASVSINIPPVAVHVSVSVQQPQQPQAPDGKKKVIMKQHVQYLDSSDDDDDDMPTARAPVARAPVARAPTATAPAIDVAAIAAMYIATKKNNRNFPILCPPKFKLEYQTDHALGLLFYTQQRKAGSSAGGLDSYIDILSSGAIHGLLLAKGVKSHKRLRSGKDIEKLAALLA